MADIVTPFMPDAAHRPPLIMPEAETAFLRAGYEQGRSILEYGSGGSTVMAAEMPGKGIFTVESDKSWLQGMQKWFDANPTPSKPILHHGNIGPTAEWGYPEGETHWKQYNRYALSVWDRADFNHPDVVLIDGRFRAACFLTVLFRIKRGVTVYFDDYVDRPVYHSIERYAEPVETVGRMARFELVPKAVPAVDLIYIMELFARPF